MQVGCEDRIRAQWKYSNLGFALLGKVVATEGGQPWDKYVQAHVVAPLGMTATRVIPRADEPSLSIGYVRTAPRAHLYRPNFFRVGRATQLVRSHRT
jgi:CubicO group peptidase (beta-lactamase class C family)